MILSIKIRPIEEAFRSGRLEMSSVVDDSVQPVAGNNPETVIISILLVFTGILLLVNLGRFLKLLPAMGRSLVNRNAGFNLEHDERSVRSRKLLALLIMLPLSLNADKTGLVCPEFLAGMSHIWRAILLALTLVFYFYVRNLLVRFPRPRRCGLDVWKSVTKGWVNVFLIFSIFGLAVSFLMGICGASDGSIRTMFTVLFALLFLLHMVKSQQILREYCSLLGSILYLCGLEIIPTGALVSLALL
ncbi:MAG: hypothetical protein MJY61_04900 [Bacteroidales bacterium]|nr:hypothetical protein [Bacteroidales bacterium]